jgi:hypothetical protein
VVARAKDTFPRTVLGTRALGSPTMVKSSVSQTVLAEPLGPVRCEDGFRGRGAGVGGEGWGSLTEKKFLARFPRQLLHLLGRTWFPTQPRTVLANYGPAAEMCKRVVVGNRVGKMLVMVQFNRNEVN